MAEPVCRTKAHSEGITLACFTSERQLITCGDDDEVHVYSDLTSVADSDREEFSVSSSSVTALTSYKKSDGSHSIALGMDDNTVQAFSMEGTSDGLLMRFTARVTCLAVNTDHTLLGAGSSDFSLKVLDLSSLPAFTSFSLSGHAAPILALKFDPQGKFLASTSCDGSIGVWSLEGRSLVKSLPVLPKCNDYSASASLGLLSWKQDGEMLAVPLGSEVKVYKRDSWDCAFTLSDLNYHTEALNTVCWSSHGDYLACADVKGRVSVWRTSKKKLWKKLQNEDQVSITALEWDSGTGPENTSLVFADKEGHVGMFDVPLPNEPAKEKKTDPLVEDSLLMEGIPADDIFGDDFDDPFLDDQNSSSGAGLVQQEAQEDGDDDVMSMLSGLSKDGEDDPRPLPQPSKPQSVKFSDKMVEVYQSSWQPSATPSHLQHRFMVYNLVGVVRCHDDDDASLIEVDFHDSSTHHSFSLPNSLGHSMAALNSQALVLACTRDEDKPSQLQCVHFGSWDSVKDWILPLPKKESIQAVAMGDGWIAVATNKRLLRLFTIGGVQREVLSLPGVVVTMAAGGQRLAVVYQTPPCTAGVYNLTVWVLDVHRRKQIHPPHTLPLTPHSNLKWIGFSEEGSLVIHDSKSIVHIHGNSSYGGASWIPVLDTSSQLNNKSDHYFVVGMTHDPQEIRAILCRGMEYPPINPRPVMSSIPLKIPLCEPDLERTEHEREYLQDLLLVPPSQSGSTADLVQQLMKMFALSCKAGREFRACEIAAMLPDTDSMELALTYASRTHRIRLARQINELMQRRAMEQDDSDNEEDEEGEDFGDEGEWSGASQLGSNIRDLPNSRKDMPGIRRGMSSGGFSRLPRHKPIGSASKPSARTGSSKSNEASRTKSVDVIDETTELFSDDEDYKMADYGNEENVNIESGGDSDEERESKEREDEEKENKSEEERSRSPCSPLDDSSLKRPNPFKLLTPVSKKISVDRQQGFLHKISARVDEEKKNLEAKKLQKEKMAMLGKANTKKAKGGKARKAAVPQKTLKRSFFKSKSVPEPSDPLTDNAADVNSQEEGMNSSSQYLEGPQPPSEKGLPEEAQDNNTSTRSGSQELSQNQKLTSAQKLANFAFTPSQSN